jgi:hypothetical protein
VVFFSLLSLPSSAVGSRSGERQVACSCPTLLSLVLFLLAFLRLLTRDARQATNVWRRRKTRKEARVGADPMDGDGPAEAKPNPLRRGRAAAAFPEPSPDREGVSGCVAVCGCVSLSPQTAWRSFILLSGARVSSTMSFSSLGPTFERPCSRGSGAKRKGNGV